MDMAEAAACALYAWEKFTASRWFDRLEWGVIGFCVGFVAAINL